ncbi:terpenoid synthase [Marasmius fiardii PR-910]|nr:terpenoid synthase [Marasmius fiardii PR-910]
MAGTSYPHLPRSNRTHIAIYTAGLSQEDPILDILAKNLVEASEYYGQLQSNLIATATLDCVTSVMMNMEVPKMAILNPSGFTVYCRNTSGIPVAYGMFIFPKDIEPAEYIQWLPDISNYINYMKYDPLSMQSAPHLNAQRHPFLSFYKEEVSGEMRNLATVLAQETLITRNEVIRRLTNDVVEAEANISTGLAGNQRAWDSWKSFRIGYVRFHTSSGRYKLDEMFELPVTSLGD